MSNLFFAVNSSRPCTVASLEIQYAISWESYDLFPPCLRRRTACVHCRGRPHCEAAGRMSPPHSETSFRARVCVRAVYICSGGGVLMHMYACVRACVCVRLCELAFVCVWVLIKSSRQSFSRGPEVPDEAIHYLQSSPPDKQSIIST